MGSMPPLLTELAPSEDGSAESCRSQQACREGRVQQFNDECKPGEVTSRVR